MKTIKKIAKSNTKLNNLSDRIRTLVYAQRTLDRIHEDSELFDSYKDVLASLKEVYPKDFSLRRISASQTWNLVKEFRRAGMPKDAVRIINGEIFYLFIHHVTPPVFYWRPLKGKDAHLRSFRV